MSANRHRPELAAPARDLRRTVALAVGSLLLAAAVGCTPLDLSKASWWPDPTKPETPTRMVDVWTDAVLHQPGKPGIRGFGGRILFYNDDKEAPIVVDGTLTVYAFDDDNPGADSTAPEKKYLFLSEQLAKHYSEAKLGPSYSFWLPWDEVGGPERQISLLARFEDREGRIVMSKVVHKALPGTEPSPGPNDDAPSIAQTSVPTENGVRRVSHEVLVDAPPKKMATTTIDVPPSFVQKVLAARDTEAATTSTASAASQTPRENLASSPDSRRPAATSDPPRGPSARSGDAPVESTAAASRPSRFARPRYPVRGAATGEPAGDSAPRRPRPVRWPSPLPRTPRSNWSQPASETSPDDQPVSY